MLRAVAIAKSWTGTQEEPAKDVDLEAKRFQQTTKAICDAAMPRVRPSGRSAMHWWTPLDCGNASGVLAETPSVHESAQKKGPGRGKRGGTLRNLQRSLQSTEEGNQRGPGTKLG